MEFDLRKNTGWCLKVCDWERFNEELYKSSITNILKITPIYDNKDYNIGLKNILQFFDYAASFLCISFTRAGREITEVAERFKFFIQPS